MANSSNSDIPVPFNLKRSSEKGGVVSIKLKVVDNEILPATAPLGHPHVLNTPSKIDEHGTWPAIRLADGVATVLSNYSHSAFKEFFDPSVKSCLLIQCTKHPKWSCSKRFLIYREGKTVIVSQRPLPIKLETNPAGRSLRYLRTQWKLRRLGWVHKGDHN
jgi:hypothetical protein